MANQEIEAKKSIAVLPDLKEEYHRALLIEMFDFSGLQRLEDAILRLLLEHFSQAFSQLASLLAARANDRGLDRILIKASEK